MQINECMPQCKSPFSSPFWDQRGPFTPLTSCPWDQRPPVPSAESVERGQNSKSIGSQRTFGAGRLSGHTKYTQWIGGYYLRSSWWHVLIKKLGEALRFPPFRTHGPRSVGGKDAPGFFLAVGEGAKSRPVLRRWKQQRACSVWWRVGASFLKAGSWAPLLGGWEHSILQNDRIRSKALARWAAAWGLTMVTSSPFLLSH